jgi:hypothetical protein
MPLDPERVQAICTRYVIGTRGKGEVSSASNHLGYRCVKVAK